MRTNILLVVTDDQRWDTAGFASGGAVHTPGLDRLAARAACFTRAYAAYSLCSPSRAAILTGQYGSRNGVNSLGGSLRRPETAIAHALRSAGYETAVCGKWHLDTPPAAAGFDWVVTFQGNGKWHDREVSRHGAIVRPPELVDSYCAGESVRFLRERDSRKPFFLWHCTQLPHMDHRHQWPATRASLDRYGLDQMPLPPTWQGDYADKPAYLAACRNRKQAESYGYGAGPEAILRHIREYRATVSDLDAALEPLWDELDAQRLWENTVVIFLSDNGWLLGEHGLTSKVLAYEPSARIPLLIAGGGARPATVCDQLASNLDVAPTILDFADLPIPPAMQGRSLRPLLAGASHADWQNAFVYEGIGGYGGVPPTAAWISGNQKVIHTWPSGQPPGGAPEFIEAYDLQADPDETANLRDHPGLQNARQAAAKAIAAHPWA